jgi:hypothetical protein
LRSMEAASKGMHRNMRILPRTDAGWSCTAWLIMPTAAVQPCEASDTPCSSGRSCRGLLKGADSKFTCLKLKIRRMLQQHIRLTWLALC